MDTCYYKTVDTTIETDGSVNKISRKYLLRQILVCSGIYAINFTYGLSFGSPTVIIPQIRQEANSSDAVSTEMASWLSSTSSYSAIVSSAILAVLARLIGRKLSFLLVCISSLIGFIIFYFSKNTTQIVISEIFHGPIAGSPLTVSVMVVTEYTSPQYRGVFLTVKSAVFLWGIWVANLIGTFFHWKYIGILALANSLFSFVTVLFWPVSPYWLISNDRFEECAVSHRWLKGCSRASEAELDLLIQSRKVLKSKQLNKRNFFKSVAKMFRSEIFYKPLILTFLVTALYQFSGKIACGMYAIDIIKRITGTETTAYTGMLILDGITILGSYLGCSISKILKRRVLLLVSSILGVSFLFCISFYLYLVHYELITENNIFSLSLLTGYSLTISVGPMIMATSILGELLPIKYRSSSVLLLGCVTNLIVACVMKICPFVLENFGVRALFLCFAVIESVFIVITYKMLPETKDKTILEIQECILGTQSTVKSVECLDDY